MHGSETNGKTRNFDKNKIQKIETKNHTHMKKVDTPQNLCFAFIDELEKRLVIKKTVEVGQ